MLRKTALLLVSLHFGLSAAQTPQSSEIRGGDTQANTTVPGVQVYTYPSMPFSGTDTITWTRSLGDGTSTTVYVIAKVVRDSQGRIYRERHHFAPKTTDPEETLYAFSITDPVANTKTECMRALHQCIVVTSYSPHIPSPTADSMPAGPFDKGQRFLARESLGTQDFGGLSAVGSLETTTISPGTVGNDRPITTTREFWYSPDLKTNLSVTRKDPREGTQVIQLAIQSRTDPDPTIFAIPAGYAVLRIIPKAKESH